MPEAFDKLAAIRPQATYTTARMGLFGILSEKLDKTLKPGEAKPVWHSFVAGFSAGAIGALVGNPADLTLIRMQVRASVGLRKSLASLRHVFLFRERHHSRRRSCVCPAACTSPTSPSASLPPPASVRCR